LVHEGENNEDYCYRWKVDNSNLFLECVDMDNVSKIVDDLDIMLQNTDVVENSQMNNVYSKVCDVFKTWADKSDMLKYTNMTKRKLPCVRTNKKWFDSECKLKRKEYHNCKNNY
jgi:hypothetical protein